MIEDTGLIADPAVGTHLPQDLRLGLHTCYGTVDVEVQNYSFLQLALRTAGALSAFDVEGGNALEGQLHHDCKVDSMAIDAVAGQKLRASMAWKGLYSEVDEDGGTNSGIVSGNDCLMWYEGAHSGLPQNTEHGTIELLRCNISISHNVDWVPVIDSGLTPVRRAKYLVEKAQNIRVNFVFLQQEDVNMAADTIAALGDVTLTFTGVDNTVKLTLTGLMPATHERPMQPYELIEHTAAYVAKDWNVESS